MFKILVCVVISLMAATTAALAQPQGSAPVQRVKLRALLADGFELKNVLLVPRDVGSILAQRPEDDGVVLSLQKGPQIATCFFKTREYLSGAVLDIEWCIPHK
jgi:actin-like ATPase involved in cell morphogenesis